MNNPWVVTSLEFQQNEIQFITLKPTDGFLNGEQARGFMLKSGLPPNVLAQVWNLADMNKDGRLDKIEFAVAVKLIRNALSGLPLPNILPDSMKVIQQAPPQAFVRPPAYGMPQMPQPYMGGPPPQPPTQIQPEFKMGTKELGDWTMPHSTKLKYSQRFNQLDRERKDYLTGQQVRGVMGESQLPAPILGQIWNLADNNKEGYLTIEKFCVAMFLIDQVKAGYALPPKLPPELDTFASRPKTESPAITPGEDPPQKTPTLKTFEDKRRDNLDKGEAELERRRQILREEEERRRMEIERKERAEAERREQERLEQERIRQAELEVQRQREKELEEQRAAEEAKLRAEREEQRRKADEERMKLLEQRHVKDLETQLQAEKEKTAQIQQRHKTMTFQLQGLEEKAAQLTLDSNASRDEIIAITSEIEAMRGQRDQKVAKIQELQAKNQQLAVQCERVSHSNLQLQTECQKSLSRGKEIEQIRNLIEERKNQIKNAQNEIQDSTQRLENQKKLVNEKKPEFDAGEERLKKIGDVYREMLEKFVAKQTELHKKVSEKRRAQVPPMSAAFNSNSNNFNTNFNSTNDAFGSNAFGTGDGFNAFPKQNDLYEAPPDANAFPTSFNDPFAPKQGDPFAPSGQTTHASPQNSSDKPPVKYRALYEFVARSDDELSLQPGDTILVFEGHASEPGWLAGQIKEKVGWFPASFAEPIAKKTSPIQNSTSASPSTEPLASIKEEPTEKDFNTDFSSAFAAGTPVAQPPSTMYDAPPGDIPSPVKPAPASVATSNDVVIAVGVAQFPWKARYDSELSFAKGDTIEILEKTEMRWRGRVQGKNDTNGWFPKSYVKLNENVPSKQSSVESNRQLSSHVTPSNSQQAIAPTSQPVSSPSGQWFVALYQFDAVESTDLSLKIGERIFVTEQEGEWWKGTANGRTGIFPANYVEKADSAPALPTSTVSASGDSTEMDRKAKVIAAFEATAENQISLHVGDQVQIKNTTPGGWWEGNVIGKEDKVGWFPGNYVQLISAASTPIGAKLADAAFDYEAQHADELSFKSGDVIEVTEQTDSEWWKGRKQGTTGESLLFPSNFVQLRNVTDAPSVTPFSKSSSQSDAVRRELIETENRFAEDLLMVRNVFMKPLATVLNEDELNKLFLNWNDLIKLSKKIYSGLQKRPPGELFCRRIDALEEFVTFCEGQQSAIDYLNHLETSNEKFRKCHLKCQEHEAVRGVSLSYYLLIPMSRITRYPLIFEKLLKETNPKDPDYEALHNAHQLLQALCARVNNAISEMQNTNMLYWSQRNIKVGNIHLEFTSETRELGPRKFLQSGIVNKNKSNKMLVALLYNDMLVLTTSDEGISKPEDFKISPSDDVRLTLYKTPFVLKNLQVEASLLDSNVFEIRNLELTVQLRAKSSNEKMFWVNQIRKAIDDYDVNSQLTLAKTSKSPTNFGQTSAGTLSVELVSLSRTDILNKPLVISLDLEQLERPLRSQITPSSSTNSLLKLDMNLMSLKQHLELTVAIFQPYRPDRKVGQVTEDIMQLVRIAAHHRGPIVRKLDLEKSDLTGRKCEAVIKFVVNIREQL
ncbi:unnamed protein product [Bursaphelenchus xylophilus]|uniref:(pine wood nematode) hypothetical protein n=1 Tax=Bursaphelenchus xylophilus TaxID=6326 RepID=A0A1I7S4D3_BURXY|nr:unnamed protein product [Bursaphelenchus xylophilus]CAG9116977.1 unnamed protein product [Bursaphelenchus xylophilus]